MRRKQLFAIILAGALAAGSAPAAVFAAESDMAAMSEEGVGDAGSEEAGSEDGSSDAEAPVTDGADAADAATDTPAADNTTTDETPAADNTGAAETPAAEDPATADTTLPEEVQTQEQTEENKEVDPQEGESTETVEDTGIVIADANGDPVKDDTGNVVYYKTLQEAVAAVADYDEAANPGATTIQISKPIVLDSTVEISGKKVNIQSTAADVTITRKTEGEPYKGAMFSVKGANSQLQFFADGSDSAALTVSGKFSDDEGEEAEGAIVEVSDSAVFGLNPGVTLKDNSYSAGGSAINSKDATVVLVGGSVTGNFGDMGAVYSNKDISIEGDASVAGNDGNKNITLDGEAKLVVTRDLTGTSSFSHKGEKDGLAVIKAGEGVTKDVLAAAVKNISYENAAKYELSAVSDGLSYSLKEVKKEEPDKPVTTDYKLSYTSNSKKWINHTTVQAKCSVTGDCEWTYFFVDAKADNASITSTYAGLKKSLKFTSVKANTEFTVKAEGVPETDSKLVVLTRKNSSDTKPKAVAINLSTSSMKKARPAKPQATATIRPERTHKVTEGTVEGFENPVKFFPKRYISFTAIGAGTRDSAPYVSGDERWVPSYWTFSTADNAEKHTSWSVGAAKGLQLKGQGSKSYTVYVYCTKEVYNGKTWEPTDVTGYYTTSFTAVEYTDEEAAEWAKQNGTDGNGGNDGAGGDGSGDGSGGTDAKLTATAAASAKDAGSKSKSAVSTADESPIGTMSVLAALSLLAGGYVVVRKRKKEEI